MYSNHEAFLEFWHYVPRISQKKTLKENIEKVQILKFLYLVLFCKINLVFEF